VLPTTWPVITVAFRCRHDGQRNLFRNGEITIAFPNRSRAPGAAVATAILATDIGCTSIGPVIWSRYRRGQRGRIRWPLRTCIAAGSPGQSLAGANIGVVIPETLRRRGFHLYIRIQRSTPPWSCWAADRDRAVSKPFGDFVGRLPLRTAAHTLDKLLGRCPRARSGSRIVACPGDN